MRPFEYLEHTADCGVLARGRSLNELFEHAALGMFGLVADFEPRDAAQAVPVVLGPNDIEGLLVDWLNELLYLFETTDSIFTEFTVFSVSADAGLRGEAAAEKINPARHRLKHEIKAVTYHRLEVRGNARDGWTARVFFDV
ncbi:MAG: archease [Terriglobia bacterium]